MNVCVRLWPEVLALAVLGFGMINLWCNVVSVVNCTGCGQRIRSASINRCTAIVLGWERGHCVCELGFRASEAWTPSHVGGPVCVWCNHERVVANIPHCFSLERMQGSIA